jgi:glycosyltransferase involved in cell wall biosynthesis
LPLGKVPPRLFATFDAAVVLNAAAPGPELRACLPKSARLILWTQHADDQPAMQPLRQPQVAAAFDAVAFVSHWQQQRYHDAFGVDLSRSRVMRNAIGPAFLAANGDRTGILTGKERPPVLAYTSTPFRGLDLLLQLFPIIRGEVPDARLRVYSSMRVYQVDAQQDDAEYGELYRRCRETAGVEYIGSLPQPALAQQLAKVTVLAYPNHFAETSCISVLEAMASGCQVVTSDLGALAETSAGFARLIPIQQDWNEYGRRFVAAAVAALRGATSASAATEGQLARQVAYVNSECTWPRRAVEWSAWLQELAVA